MSSGDLLRFWGAVDYEADLRYYDHMYDVAQQFRHEFAHWATDRLAVLLHDPERHESLRMACKRVAFEGAAPDSIETSLKRLSDTVARVLRSLRRNTVNRMGIKVVAYADVGLSFEELREQIRPLCLPKNKALEALTSATVSDVALSFDYEWEGKTGMLRVGPMTAKQGRANLTGVGELEKLFPPHEESDELAALYSHLPESFLYLDLDVYTEEERGADEWSQFSQDVIPHVVRVQDGVKALIMEREK